MFCLKLFLLLFSLKFLEKASYFVLVLSFTLLKCMLLMQISYGDLKIHIMHIGTIYRSLYWFSRVFWNDFNMKCSCFVTIYLLTAQYQAIPKSNVSVKFTDILVCLISLHSFF